MSNPSIASNCPLESTKLQQKAEPVLTRDEQTAPEGIIERVHKLAMQIGVVEAGFHVMHRRQRVWVVHHDVKHLINPQPPNCLEGVVLQTSMPC